MARKNPVARAGNYAQEMDSGAMGTMDQSMRDVLFNGGDRNPTAMTGLEKRYVKGVGGRSSATEAVKRARKANRQPPLAGS
jgi:hypothetical protein